MNYSLRLNKLRESLPALECNALVVTNLTNVRYLCGFSGSSGMAIVTNDKTYFVTDFRYQSQAAQQVPAECEVVIAREGLWKEAARLLDAKDLHVGFEAEHISVATRDEIAELLPDAQLVSTKRAIEELRLFKDVDEIAIIERAIQVIDECFEAICRVLEPGQTERFIAQTLQDMMRERGATGPSFDTIVASGIRGALPHGIASDKTIERGEMITIDMGAVVDGYCSDCTRTVCLGAPTGEQQRIYALVWDAQTAAANALRPGLSCFDADEIARAIIREAGLVEAFGHGLGHGVGMEIHEPPRLSFLGKGDLQAGMIVTCEPGIYLEGWGGVRIEDMLLITDDGHRVLTKATKPREIIVL